MIKKTEIELIVETAEAVIIELNLANIENSSGGIPFYFYVKNGPAVERKEIYKRIMRTGGFDPKRVNTVFIDKVMKQIVYFLKYSEL